MRGFRPAVSLRTERRDHVHGVRMRLAAVSLVVLVTATVAAWATGHPEGAPLRPNAGVPAGTLLVSTGSSGAWLQTKRLDGTGARDVTRRVARYEARVDDEASFSPDGTTVAFRRQSKRDRFSVMVARRNGTGIRRVLTLARANRLVPGANNLGGPLFAPDGRRVVVATRRFSCSTEAVLSVGLDGERPAVVWRRPKGELLSVSPVEVLEDGTVLAVASANDGDCYYGHTGPDRLVLLRAGSGPRTLGPPSSAVGEVLLAPDGRTVVWVADCIDVCQLWSADLATGAARRLTRFETRTVPLDGYDSIAVALLGEDVLVYGRGRSVYVRPLSGAATVSRLATFPCPRKKGCRLSQVERIVTSPDGAWVIVDVTDWGCETCYTGSPEPISERFAVETAGGQRTKLPALPFSDLRFG